MENFPKEKGEKGEKKSSRLTLDFLPTQESSSFEFLSCISYALLATRTMIPVWLVRFSHSVNTTPSPLLLLCNVLEGYRRPSDVTASEQTDKGPGWHAPSENLPAST